MSAATRGEWTRAIDAVCFDCWGTLLVEINPQSAHRRRVEAVVSCADGYGVPVSSAAAHRALDRAWHQHWDRWQQGVPNGALEISRDALDALGIDAAPAAVELANRLAGSVQVEDVAALPGAQRTLEALSDAGLRLALVCDTGFTNGDGVRRLLDATGLLRCLEVQAFSDETGVPKPHRRIFEHALTGIDSTARSAVHVGDLRRTDVAGARALGMKTVRIRWAHDDTSDHPDADAVVDSHDDLSALFGLTPGPVS